MVWEENDSTERKMNSENKQEPVPNDTTKTIEKPSAKNVCCGIYGLKNKINGKWYVGQSVDVIDRWNHAYKRVKCHTQPKIYNALKKYGYDNFEKIILEECDNVDWILDYREMYWIRSLNSVENGYNATYGGTTNTTRGTTLSPKTKNTLSKKSRAQWIRQRGDPRRMKQITQKLSVAQKLAWKSPSIKINHVNAMTDVWKTEKHRKKMLESYLNRPTHRFIRKDGMTFTGTRYEFLRAFPELHDGCISSVLTGNRKSHRGWTVAKHLIPELGDDSCK